MASSQSTDFLNLLRLAFCTTAGSLIPILAVETTLSSGPPSPINNRRKWFGLNVTTFSPSNLEGVA